jgi:predicted RNase H-like HicB family nuclease
MKAKRAARQVGPYAVILEKTRTGYSAYAPDLPGCIAAGDTVRQTAELMREAIEMHVAGMCEDGLPVPEPGAVSAARRRNP